MPALPPPYGQKKQLPEQAANDVLYAGEFDELTAKNGGDDE